MTWDPSRPFEENVAEEMFVRMSRGESRFRAVAISPRDLWGCARRLNAKIDDRFGVMSMMLVTPGGSVLVLAEPSLPEGSAPTYLDVPPDVVELIVLEWADLDFESCERLSVRFAELAIAKRA